MPKPLVLVLTLTLGLCPGLNLSPANAAYIIKIGSLCTQPNQVINQGAISLQCIASEGRNVWSTSPLYISPPVLTNATDPHLACDGSGELTGRHPGWQSIASQKLTIISLNNSYSAIYWCPAAAPNGQGAITYTVTSSLGALTCITTSISCLIAGITPSSNLSLMASDQTGSYLSNESAIQNSGVPIPCVKSQMYCNPGSPGLIFPSYGNIAPTGVGNCTFAAVANWEQIALGIHADPSLINAQFKSAGGSAALGLTDQQVFNYWSTFGIAGVFLKEATPVPIDPQSLMHSIDDRGVRAVIASLSLSKNQNFAGTSNPTASYHWVVVDGYTPQGPLVVTWGKRLQMSWQQWNLEAVSMWSLSTGNAMVALRANP